MHETETTIDTTFRQVSLEGLWVALATPFSDDGGVDRRPAVDLDAFRDLAARCLAGGVQGLLVLGSTGEAATLSDPERDRLIDATLEVAAGAVPVMVGTGSNDTHRTVEWTRRARSRGADAALVVTPFYNKPNPEGLVAHFETVAAAVPELPLVVYNVPGRTGLNLSPSTLGRLWQIPQVRAIKESSGDLAQIDRVLRDLPPGRVVLAGDDGLALAAIALGAEGLVSVAANLEPEAMRRLVDAARAGRLVEARSAHSALSPLFDALFLESNPVPLKAALALRGEAYDMVRPPLARAGSETRLRLATVLDALAPREAA